MWAQVLHTCVYSVPPYLSLQLLLCPSLPLSLSPSLHPFLPPFLPLSLPSSLPLSLSPTLPPSTLSLPALVQFASYTCQVSGPGLHSAHHPTHVLVELSDSSGRPCSLQQNVTAELELISEATPTSPSHETGLVVATMSPSQYEVSYTAVSRGQHKVHVEVNDRKINGSPFTMTVYPDPAKLGCPVRVVTGLDKPYGIAFNSRGEMIISECVGNQISIRGQKIRTFGFEHWTYDGTCRHSHR